VISNSIGLKWRHAQNQITVCCRSSHGWIMGNLPGVARSETCAGSRKGWSGSHLQSDLLNLRGAV
jgi:hypothetical protein